MTTSPTGQSQPPKDKLQTPDTKAHNMALETGEILAPFQSNSTCITSSKGTSNTLRRLGTKSESICLKTIRSEMNC
ncbi:hypothetical protein RRF57_011854 [Xylaria bambusicola]|uniref:Uncharacterized protein n=1 Tax=Xylaria bambusicola TaxID=326684 RepID=A0AAN7ZAA0_9PEZI